MAAGAGRLQREVDAATAAVSALDAEVEKARRALGTADERVSGAARVVAVGEVERLAADLDLAIRTATSLRAAMLGADFLPPAPGGRPGLPMTPAVQRVIAAHAAILAILDDDRRPK